jgi:hypothetical protein
MSVIASSIQRGNLDIRTCKSSWLLGIGNITWYSQQIHNVKSRGVKFGYLGDYAIDPLHSNTFSNTGRAKAFEGILKEKQTLQHLVGKVCQAPCRPVV